MFKTVMKPTIVFDTDKLHIGTKIKYTFHCPDGEIYDWGYGEIIMLSEDKMMIDYDSEMDSILDFNMELQKQYKQAYLTSDMVGDIHKIELVEGD